MPRFASIVWADTKSAPAESCIRVPEYVMKSPTSKGACWRASGWTWLPLSGMAVVASAGGAAMTYCEQYFWPAAGGVSSPDPAGGTTPAWLKLRHVVAVTGEPPTVTVTRFGRFCWGQSGSSCTVGSVRGMHIG